MIGQANNCYAFKQFDEAISIFEEVIRRMPDLPEITQTMSLIYAEKEDYERSFQFAFISAFETRNDSEKWKSCAHLALKLKNYH